MSRLINNRCRVAIGRAPGNEHWQCFVDFGVVLVSALRRLGYDCDALGWAGFRPDSRKLNILLGWHLMDEFTLATLPQGTILYNLEQLRNRRDGMLAQLVALSHLYQVWDYSRANVSALDASGAKDVKLVPVGSMAAFEHGQEPRHEPATDVLFYGSLNDRRIAMLQEVGKRVRVRAIPCGTYGAPRDRLVDDAKVILNVHYYVPGSFEIIRCAHLFEQHKAVVAERNADTELDADLYRAAEFVPYEKLPEACERLVRDEEARRELEQRGYEVFSRRNEVNILREALEPGVVRAPATRSDACPTATDSANVTWP